MADLTPPDPASADWLGLSERELPVTGALGWASVPGCGAIVTFCGLVRDHSEGRPGVVALEYEAYPEQVGPRLAAIAEEARRRWPDIGRVALLHRTGSLGVGEVSVVVVVSAPHRPQAFAAAAYGIDAIKATVPIWKLETWEGGRSFSECTHPVTTADGVAGPVAAPAEAR